MEIVIDGKLAGRSVRDVLQRELGFSSNLIKKLKFSENGILVDGRFVTVRHVLTAGELLSLPPQRSGFPWGKLASADSRKAED